LSILIIPHLRMCRSMPQMSSFIADSFSVGQIRQSVVARIDIAVASSCSTRQAVTSLAAARAEGQDFVLAAIVDN
jgi:hypothetical protein